MSVALVKAERSPHDGTVLTLLRDLGPTSRVRLSELTGLSPTTVGKVVAPLVERGLLRESVVRSRGAGRPAMALIPIPEAVTMCGVQIGAGGMRIGLADAAYEVRAFESLRFDVGDDPDQVIRRACEVARRLIRDAGGSTCVGVGVGVPGPVDADLRRLDIGIPLAWHGGIQDAWRHVSIADLFEQHLGLPTVVDHNVRSMALAESRYHTHTAETLAYLNLDAGVGIAVSVRGQVFRGGGGESYLGHTRVAEGGERCRCGSRGCLETIVCEPYLRERLAAVPGHAATAGTDQDGVLETLRALVKAGSPEATAIENDLVEHLSAAMATVVNLFTPDLVLVGGMFGNAPDPTIGALREGIRERIFPPLRPDFRLARADVSPEAPVRAGAAIALERLHFG